MEMMMDTMFERMANATGPSSATPIEPVPVSPVPASVPCAIDRAERRVRIQRALLATLGDTYDCTRVWSAWGYGTMDEDDFAPVLDRMEEIIDEIDAALAQAGGAGTAETPQSGSVHEHAVAESDAPKGNTP